MNSLPNKRRWIVPVAWLGTAAAAFSIGRMSSWLEEPITPPAHAGSAAGQAGSNGAGLGPGQDRVGGTFAVGDEKRPIVTVGEVTGGQPLGDWLKKLMALDDDIYRMQNFIKLFDALNSVEDIKAALEALSGGNDRGGGRGRGLRFTEYSMLLQKLTRLDPKEALAFAEKAGGGDRFMATGTVLRAWSKTEPDAALAWAKENGVQQQQEDGNNRGGRGGEGQKDNWALSSVVTQLAKTNLDKAIHEASSTELGRTGGRTAEALVGEAIEQRGLDEAIKMAGKLPEGPFQNEFVQSLAQRLGRTDPDKALSWLGGMASGDMKSRGLAEALDQIMENDPAKATTYVSKLPVGPDYDRSRETVARNIGRTDPTQALTMIGQISDPERQQQTTTRLAFDIYRRDPAQGQQFLMASALPDETKTQMLQAAQRMQQRGGQGGGGGDFGGFRRFGGGGPGGGGR